MSRKIEQPTTPEWTKWAILIPVFSFLFLYDYRFLAFVFLIIGMTLIIITDKNKDYE